MRRARAADPPSPAPSIVLVSPLHRLVSEVSVTQPTTRSETHRAPPTGPVGAGLVPDGDLAFADRPFLRWRERLLAWKLAHADGWSDDAFVSLVDGLDRAVTTIDGRGFRVTPLVRVPGHDLAGTLYMKDETRSVAGTHHARHLFGRLLTLEVRGASRERPLVVAGGSALAIAGAVLAAAARRTLHAYLRRGTPADVVKRLSDLGAFVTLCDPEDGRDPCPRALREAMLRGALPLSCAGLDEGLAPTGAETLAWEVTSELAGRPLDHAFVQVHRGVLVQATGRALGHAVARGALVQRPRLHAVQLRGASPLATRYELVAQELDSALGLGPAAPRSDDASASAIAFRLRRADRIAAGFGDVVVQRALRQIARRPHHYLRAWDEAGFMAREPDESLGDWLGVVTTMLESGGVPVIVDDALEGTATLGLAGYLALAPSGRLRAASDDRDDTADPGSSLVVLSEE